MPNPATLFLMATGVYLFVMLILAAIFAGGLYLAWRGSGNRLDQSRRSFLTGRGKANDHALFFGLQLVIHRPPD
jgi:hypothetical protein